VSPEDTALPVETAPLVETVARPEATVAEAPLAAELLPLDDEGLPELVGPDDPALDEAPPPDDFVGVGSVPVERVTEVTPQPLGFPSTMFPLHAYCPAQGPAPALAHAGGWGAI
jgi:hypothetical protein